MPTIQNNITVLVAVILGRLEHIKPATRSFVFFRVLCNKNDRSIHVGSQLQQAVMRRQLSMHTRGAVVKS